MSNTNLKLNEINDLATKVLLKYGCDNENASAVANVIESAEAAWLPFTWIDEVTGLCCNT
jgi:LDH2 family malate/lactate/ureidoglycolate dehydrogenase